MMPRTANKICDAYKAVFSAVIVSMSIHCVSVAADDSALSNSDLKSANDVFAIALEHKIRLSWFPPKMRLGKPAIVTFKLTQNGQPTNVHLLKSSGNKLLDLSAMQAIQNVNMTKQVPTNILQVVFRYTFDDEALTVSALGPGGSFDPSRLTIVINDDRH